MINKKLLRYRNSRLRCKLSFDEGFAEQPIYSIKGFTNEKDKGIDMIELIKNNFSITQWDIEKGRSREAEEQYQHYKKSQGAIKWTRDDKGNIVSPFSRRELLIKNDLENKTNPSDTQIKS